MQLQQLRYLQLVVERGSFAAAARAAGVSAPAVTLAIQGLEREWGVALFEKAGRQKLPTRAAVVAAQRAAELLSRFEALPGAGPVATPWSPGRDAAWLKAGMAPAAALLYGPTVEREWRALEPEGLLQIVGGSAHELLAALQGRELDLVIAPRPRRFPLAGIRRLALHTSTPTVYARAGHPLAGAGSLADIAEAGWAVTGRAGTAGNVIEEAHRVRRLAAPRILVQCADYPALLELVAQTDLLCVVPHPALGPAAAGRIVALGLREGLPRYEVCLFWSPGRQRPQARVLAAIVNALRRGVARAPRRLRPLT